MLLYAWLILYHGEIKKSKRPFFACCSFSLVLVTLGDNGNAETRWPEEHDSQSRELERSCPWPYILGLLCEAGAMEKRCIISSLNVAQDLNILPSIPDLANKARLNSKDMPCFRLLCLQRQRHS